MQFKWVKDITMSVTTLGLTWILSVKCVLVPRQLAKVLKNKKQTLTFDCIYPPMVHEQSESLLNCPYNHLTQYCTLNGRWVCVRWIVKKKCA